jgi:hypothetical protein
MFNNCKSDDLVTVKVTIKLTVKVMLNVTVRVMRYIICNAVANLKKYYDDSGDAYQKLSRPL